MVPNVAGAREDLLGRDEPEARLFEAFELEARDRVAGHPVVVEALGARQPGVDGDAVFDKLALAAVGELVDEFFVIAVEGLELRLRAPDVAPDLAHRGEAVLEPTVMRRSALRLDQKVQHLGREVFKVVERRQHFQPTFRYRQVLVEVGVVAALAVHTLKYDCRSVYRANYSMG